MKHYKFIILLLFTLALFHACSSTYVNSVTFSPDGRQILSGSNDSTIRLWDVNTGNLLKTIGTEKNTENWGR